MKQNYNVPSNAINPVLPIFPTLFARYNFGQTKTWKKIFLIKNSPNKKLTNTLYIPRHNHELRQQNFSRAK